MNPRNTVVMFLVVLGLGAFWYFHDVKGGHEREEAKTRQERLFPTLEEDQLTSLRLADLKAGGKAPVVLEKSGGRWLLRGDRDYLAAQAEITGLVGQVATMKRESVIAEAPAPKALGQYGLEKPRFRLDLGTAEKGKSYTLFLGDRTPDDSGYYARTGEAGPVVAVNSAFMSALEKPLQDLREKSPLALEPTDVTRIVLKPASGPETVLVRDSKPKEASGSGAAEAVDRWRLEAPLKAPADARKVSDFLWAWKSLQAGRFLQPDEKVDFAKPVLRIEISGTGAGEPVVLEVGPAVAVKPGMVYVRRSSPEETMVVELGDKQHVLVGQAGGDFEDRHLLGFTEDEVDRMAATVEGQEIEARRIRDGWEVGKPAPAVKDENARNTAVSDLLYAAKDLEWTTRGGPGAPAKIEKPRATLSLYGKDGKLLGTLQVGDVAPSGGVWASSTGTAEVLRLAQDPLPKWRDVLRRLQDRKPAVAASPGTVASPAP